MQEFSGCDSCGAKLDDINVEMPIYCIPCIEEMARLNLSPKRYKKYWKVKQSNGNGAHAALQA